MSEKSPGPGVFSPFETKQTKNIGLCYFLKELMISHVSDYNL